MGAPPSARFGVTLCCPSPPVFHGSRAHEQAVRHAGQCKGDIARCLHGGKFEEVAAFLVAAPRRARVGLAQVVGALTHLQRHAAKAVALLRAQTDKAAVERREHSLGGGEFVLRKRPAQPRQREGELRPGAELRYVELAALVGAATLAANAQARARGARGVRGKAGVGK